MGPGKPSCVTVFRAELPHQFGNALKPALRVVCVKCLAQAISRLLGFELQQHAVQQRQLLAIHALNLLMQDRFKPFRRHGITIFHAQTIHL